MTQHNSAGPFTAMAGEPRQLLFVALCSLALVLAAFAAPPATQGVSPPDVPFPSLSGNESKEAGDCVVALSENPVPGRQVTVTVHHRDQPVEGVQVWFNDRVVGATDQFGQVDGRVPYVQNLEIAVGLPDGVACEFVTATGARMGADPHTETGSRTGQTSNVRSGLPGPNGALDTSNRPPAQSTEEANVTGTYAVHSRIDVEVVGEPNPGENVTLVATIESDPVPGATVSVAGREVGTTDEKGRHAIRVPNDGTSRLPVTVERGELQSQHTIDVRLLRVAILTDERFPLPGQSATARATIGNERVESAAVTLDGEPVGTTDHSGRVTFSLPADPTATVTVTTGDRVARTAILSAFAPTIVAFAGALVLLLGGPLAVYWANGRRGLLGLGVLVTLFAAGAGGYAIGGRSGAFAAAAAVATLVAVMVIARRPTAARDVGTSAGHRVEAFVEWLTDGVLWVTRGIEAFLDASRDALSSASGRLRRDELAPLAADIWAWIAAIPGRAEAAVGYLIRLPRRVVAWLRTEPAPDEGTENDGYRRPRSTETPGPTIRVLWRAFARSVVPDRWPQRTPGEVSRRAIDAGFPRDSVAELTTVFRDVEYGGESLSADRYQRARAAFDALDLRRGDADSGGVAGEGTAEGHAAAGHAVTGEDDVDEEVPRS